ncbi:MAG: FHA domain-containing protein, partial [Myxococcota bacterium]
PAPRAATQLGREPERARGEGRGEFERPASKTGALEVTAVRDVPPKPAVRGGRIKVLAGPDAGFDRVIDQNPSVLGRTGELRLSDPSVSRRHLELRLLPDESAWIVSDLGSSSGTLLNGLPLAMSTELKHGDVLAVGQSELRFSWAERMPKEKPVEVSREPTFSAIRLVSTLAELTGLTRAPTGEARAPSTREATSTGLPPAAIAPRPSRLPLVFGGLLLLVTIAGAFTWFRALESRSRQTQTEAQVQTLLEDAQRLFTDGELAQSRARLEAVFALVPEHPLGESLMKMVESDEAASAALAETRQLLAAGLVDEAEQRMRFIPDASRFASEREALRATVEKQAQSESLRQCEALIDDGELDRAETQLRAHLERWTQDTFALAMMRRVERTRNAPPPDHPAVARARDAFQAGDDVQARLFVEPDARRGAAAPARYLEQLLRYQTSIDEGETLLGRKDRRAAVPLERALGLIGRLGRPKASPRRQKLEGQLADAWYLEAMAKRQGGDECAWAAFVRRGLSLAPTEKKLLAQATEAERRAESALARAEARLGHDPAGARRIVGAAQCLVSRGSPVGERLHKLAR